MKALPVLIVAARDDLHAHAVLDALARRGSAGGTVDLADLTRGDRLSLACGDGDRDVRFRLDGGKRLALSDVGTVWWRRPRRPDPDLALDRAEGEFVRSEWEHFVDGMEALAPVRWVNRPSANRAAGRKARQLALAAAEGLRVPRTLFTNDAESVREFAERVDPLIYKRMGATAEPAVATRMLRREDLARLDVLVNCPAIFQEHIPARLDIRATVFGDVVRAAEIDSQSGDAPLDWRLDHSVPFRPHALDAGVERRLLALMRRLGLSYGAIDLRLTPEGEYVFLEVNPGGQFLFVELLTEVPLSSLMADLLLAGG